MKWLTNKEADKRQSHITAAYTLACNHLCCKTRHYTCSLKLPVAAHCSTCKVYQAVICGDLWVCECVSVSPSPAVSVSPCVPEFPVRLCLYVCMSLGRHTLVWMYECKRVWACVRLWMHGQLCEAARLLVRGWACDTASLLAAVTVPSPLRVERGRRRGRSGGRVAESTDLGHDRTSGRRGDARLRRLHWLGGRLGQGLGGHNHGGLLRSRHRHGRRHGALLEEQGRDREINRTWRLAGSKATENRRQAPQRSCHIWCPDFGGHRLTDKEEEGEVVTGKRRELSLRATYLTRETSYQGLVLVMPNFKRLSSAVS